MIVGIGCDICEIYRIEKRVSKQHFKDFVFSQNEQILSETFHNNKSIMYAEQFAAKEAFLKAVGTGLRGGKINGIEVLYDDNEIPYVVLDDFWKCFVKKLGVASISLSLCHTHKIAIAYIILLGKNSLV